MKKLFCTIAGLLIGLIAMAQTTPEAIIGMCPKMPTADNIGEFMVTGKNAQVEKYFRQLGEANRKYTAAIVEQYSHIDYAQEERNMMKRQQQMLKKQASAMEAGQRMQKFMASLTPEQQKKMMSFRNEADAMQYLASIGKLDELRDLMEGTHTSNDNSVVDRRQMDLAQRDLSAELEAVDNKIFEAKAKLNEFTEGLSERADRANEAAIEAHRESSGVGGAWDIVAVEDDMKAFYASQTKTWNKLLLDYMNAIENSIPVKKMLDEQQNAARSMQGRSKVTAAESAACAAAMEYMRAASQILPGGDISSSINGNPSPEELMDDNTQEINSMEE